MKLLKVGIMLTTAIVGIIGLLGCMLIFVLILTRLTLIYIPTDTQIILAKITGISVLTVLFGGGGCILMIELMIDSTDDQNEKGINMMNTNIITRFGVSIISKILEGAEEDLSMFAEKMPGGQFLNLHTDKVEKAEAIGIQLNGTVVLLTKHGCCSVNPLKESSRDGNPIVVLSEWSCGGTFIPDYNFKSDIDWGASIDRYNNDLPTYSYEKSLIAVYDFAAE